MSYRQPAFMLDNLIGAITDVANDVAPRPQTSSIGNTQRRAFVDGRYASIGFYSATGANAGVGFDLGAVPTTRPNRLVIPASHSGFNGEILQVYHDNNFSFPSATLASSALVSGTGVIDRSLSSGTERFWTVQVSTSVNSDVYTLRGYWLGFYEQLSSAAAVDPSFNLGWRSQQTETEYPGGVAVAQLAIPRRTFSLRVADVDPASADYTLLDNVMQARARSFWYWPPDDETPGPFLVRLGRDSERVQDFGSPSQAIRYRFDFEFVEENL